MSHVTIDDVLAEFVGRGSYIPSSMGAQLERLATGITSAPDAFRARSAAEDQVLRHASILRTISDFTSRKEFRDRPDTLKKIQRATHPMLDQGYIAVGILRAYHEWSTGSGKERGLVQVYRYLSAIAPDVVPAPPKGTDDLLQAFRDNTAKRARSLAAEAYADAFLALEQFLRIRNKKADRAS